MLGAINRFYQHERGATATEYVMVAAGSQALGGGLGNLLTSVGNMISTVVIPTFRHHESQFALRHKRNETGRLEAGRSTPSRLGAERFRSDLWTKLNHEAASRFLTQYPVKGEVAMTQDELAAAARRLAHALGIPFYVRGGRIYQKGPGLEFLPPTGAGLAVADFSADEDDFSAKSDEPE